MYVSNSPTIFVDQEAKKSRTAKKKSLAPKNEAPIISVHFVSFWCPKNEARTLQ